jgi:tetratricopeptide (TPR) repeat protein
VLAPAWAAAQQISYEEFQKQAETEINLQPEYGHAVKSQGQINADQKFIDEEVKQLGTRRQASEEMVRLGFDYFYKGDLVTAMYRFNQAWLLEPNNENAYWGFGAIYATFNDILQALIEYDKGLKINPLSANILTDKGTVYMGIYQQSQSVADIATAISLFQQSYKVDPANQNTLFKLSAAYYYKHDCANALRYYNECMKLGGKSISPGYGDALKTQCGN